MSLACYVAVNERIKLNRVNYFHFYSVAVVGNRYYQIQHIVLNTK